MRQGALNTKGTRRVQVEAQARCKKEVDQGNEIFNQIAKKEDAVAVADTTILESH